MSYRINTFWLRKIANALGKRYKINIKEGQNWSANIETKTIVYTNSISALDKDSVIALLMHEIGHIRFSKTMDSLGFTKEQEKFKQLTTLSFNLVEDTRIDALMLHEYAGGEALYEAFQNQATLQLRQSLERLNKDLQAYPTRVAQITKELESAFNGKKYKKLNEAQQKEWDDHMKRNAPNPRDKMSELEEVLALSLVRYHRADRLAFDPKKYHSPKIMIDADKVVKEMDEGFVEQIPTCEEAKQFFDDKIYPIVKKYFTKEEEKKQQKKEQQQQQQAGEAGEGGKINQNVRTKSEQELEEFAKALQKEKGLKNRTSDENKEEEDDKKIAGGLNPSELLQKNNYLDDAFDYNKAKLRVSAHIRRNKPLFTRILRDNKYDRYAGRFRTGRLNQRRLYKFASGDNRLFHKKIETKNKSYAFSIVIDVSGSMQGSTFTNSFGGLVMMSEILNSANVPFELKYFHSEFTNVKGFHEALNPKVITERGMKMGWGGTRIANPIKEAVKNLNGIEAERKILVCLTDGAVSRRDEEYIRGLLNRNKHIDTYGIGIGSDLKTLFKDSVNVQREEHIIEEFAKIFKKHVS